MILHRGLDREITARRVEKRKMRNAKRKRFVRAREGSAFLDDRLSLSPASILGCATTWLGLLLIKSLRATDLPRYNRF